MTTENGSTICGAKADSTARSGLLPVIQGYFL
jgi:hypothetical protein